MSISLLRQLLMKEAVKKSAGSSGIMTINRNIATDVDKLLQKYVNDALAQGVDLETLSPEQLKMIVAMNAKATNRVISGSSAEGKAITEKLFGKRGEVIEGNFGKSFKEQIEDMKKSGDIVDPNNLKKNDNVTEREMFKNSNLNKEGTIMDRITTASNRIKQIQKEQDEMYRPKTDAEIKAKFDKQNKDSVERLKKKNRDSMPIRLMKNFEKELNEADLMAEGYSKDQANVLIKARQKMTSGEEMNPNESLLRVKEEFADKAGVDVDDFTDIDFEIDIPDYAKGGRAGYAVGNQVMPAVDARMNVDYNTLVDQNTAQRGFMDNWRNHAITSQKMKGKAGLESIPNYGMQSGYDFKKNFQDMNPKVAAGLSLGYQGLTEGLGMFNPNNPNFLNPIKTGKTIYNDYQKNVEGILNAEANNLTPKEQADRNKYLEVKDPVVDQNRISEIVEQQKAAGVPDEGLITNFNKPTMADVAGPSNLDNFRDALYSANQFDKETGDRLFGGQLERMQSEYLNSPNDYFFAGDDTQSMYDRFNKIYSPSQTLSNNEKKLIERSQPGSLEQYLSGYEKYKSTNPNRYTGTQALVDATLPGGIDYTFNDSSHANHFNDYLESIGLSPYEKNSNAISKYLDSAKFNKGGRAGFYTGGITDVEPSLDDIGHGADALNARTRLMSPGAQATTSTGLNYLLAEDNDNMRIPFAGGGGGRRAFLKFLASIGGLTAAAKSGMIGFGEGTTKKAVSETVKQAAGSGGKVPPYFFKLVEKIKTLGDDASNLATQDRQKVTKFKDYQMTEDVSTGNIEILKQERGGFREDVFMSYKVDDVPIKGKKGSTKVEEYEEFTARPDQDGKMRDIEQGVPDEVVNEGSVFEDNMTEFGMTKKADGGRIGFSAGSLAKLGINSTSRRFLEKVFGKEKFKTMIQNDPRMHRGMLEVAEMFRSKDKEGLKMYLQKFMPNMDDTEIEKFIIGDSGTEGIEGQLIRLGSGREYENLIKMSKEADQIRKLDDFDIDGVSKNAEGGRIGFSGGGIFRAIIAKAAAKKGLKPYEFIKVTSYKSLPPEVKMFLSAEDFARLKSGQQEMYTNYIDMAKTRKNFQEQVEGGKTTPAKPLFENMEKMMDEQSYVPKNVTSDDIAEMELMVKNRFNKGRKDNAQGGLQTMLGE